VTHDPGQGAPPPGGAGGHGGGRGPYGGYQGYGGYGHNPYAESPYGQSPYGGAPGWGYRVPPPPPKPGVVPLGPLDLNDIFGGAFAAMIRYRRPLLGVGGVLIAVQITGMGLAFLIGFLSIRDTVDAITAPGAFHPTGGQSTALAVAGLAVGLAVLVLGLLVASALYALCQVVVEQAVVGWPLPGGEAWRRTRARMFAVLGTVALTALRCLLPPLAGAAVLVPLWIVVSGAEGGTIAIAVEVTVVVSLAVIAGVVWQWVKLSLAVPVTVIEGQGPVSALRRSARLVRGAWWRILGIMLLAGVAVGAVNAVVQRPFSFVSGFASALWDPDATGTAADLPLLAVGLLVAPVVGLLGQMLLQLVSGLLYIDRRIRTEGLAEQLARAAGVDLPKAG
jgi:hypothetical protein